MGFQTSWGLCRSILKTRLYFLQLGDFGFRLGLQCLHSPGDDLAILHELPPERFRCIESEPGEGVRAFIGAARCCFAAHFGAAPAGAHAVDDDIRQRGGHLHGETVQGGLADAVSGCPGLRFAIELTGAAGDVDDARSFGGLQKREKGFCGSKRADEVGGEGFAENLRLELKRLW